MHARRQPRRVIATRPMERRRRRRRALVALGITSALVAGTAYGTWQYIEDREFLLDERCEVTVGEQTMTLSPAQARSAADLAVAAADRGLPPQAAVHAMAMSLQETDLLDRSSGEEGDSAELFARGNPSWSDGPSAEVAETSISGFFDVLEESWQAGQADEDADDGEDEAPEHWNPQLELDAAAEVLERPHNAQFYPQHLPTARAFAWPLVGQQPVDMTCHISQLEVSGPDPVGVVDEIVASMPHALEIPFTEAPENDDGGDDEAAEFVAEPILDDVIESTGEGEDAVLQVQVPEHEDNVDYQWMLAHWAIAVARDYGIQSVEAGAYTWDRESGRWTREDEVPASNTEVSIGFSPAS